MMAPRLAPRRIRARAATAGGVGVNARRIRVALKRLGGQAVQCQLAELIDDGGGRSADVQVPARPTTGSEWTYLTVRSVVIRRRPATGLPVTVLAGLHSKAVRGLTRSPYSELFMGGSYLGQRWHGLLGIPGEMAPARQPS